MGADEYNLGIRFTSEGASEVQNDVRSNIDIIKEYYNTIASGQPVSDELMSSYRQARGEIVQQNRAYKSLELAYREQYEGLFRTTEAMSRVGAVARETMNVYNSFMNTQTALQLSSMRLENAQKNVAKAHEQAQQEIQKAQEALQLAEQRLADAERTGSKDIVKYQQDVERAKQNLANITQNANERITAAEQQLKIVQEENARMQREAMIGYINMGIVLATTLPRSIFTAVTSMQTLIGSETIQSTLAPAVTGAFTTMGTAARAFGASLYAALGPIGLIILAITLIAGAFIWAYENIKPFRDAINTLASFFQAVFLRILDLIVGYFKLWIEAAQVLWRFLQPIVDALSKVAGFFGGVFGAVGGALHAIGLQEGGIVTKPTVATIGEAGPEAVIPLNRMGGAIGSPRTINVNVNIGTANIVDNRSIEALAKAIGKHVANEVYKQEGITRRTP